MHICQVHLSYYLLSMLPIILSLSDQNFSGNEPKFTLGMDVCYAAVDDMDIMILGLADISECSSPVSTPTFSDTDLLKLMDMEFKDQENV